MKKALSIVLALLMLLAMIPASLAQETAPVVYVTIADQGLKLVQRPIVLHDTDNDGVLTIADALYLAHEEGYEGGAAAGFARQASCTVPSASAAPSLSARAPASFAATPAMTS